MGRYLIRGMVSLCLWLGACSTGTGRQGDAGPVDQQQAIDLAVPGCSPLTVPAQVLVVCTEPPLFGEPLAGQVEGDATVTGWGVGFEGCLQPFATRSEYAALTEAAHLLRLRTADGGEQSFGVVLQGVNPVITAGANVRFVYSRTGGGFGPDVGRLQLTTGTGDLILYVGVGGRPEQMTPPPGVTFSLGSLTCADAQHCGLWGKYPLSITAGTETVELAPGASGRVGALAVVVGQSEQQIGNSSMCTDWFVSRTTVAITP